MTQVTTNVAMFTLMRGGEPVFTLGSRRQSELRKVTDATYKEAIMEDDSIAMTVLSTVPLDFRLRDYIVYDGRPYLLNTIPDGLMDDARRYTYRLSFEGAMFELGRVAFIIDGNGFDYYGTLSDFARLVVDNMDRVNMWVGWNFDDGQGSYVRYTGKFMGRYTIQNTLVYKWGVGFNSELEGMCERYIFTIGMPSVGDFAVDPESLAPIDGEGLETRTCVVTDVHRWALDFPPRLENDPVYPTPTPHIPDAEYPTVWDDGTLDDYSSALDSFFYEGSSSFGIREASTPYETGSWWWDTPLNELSTLRPVQPPKKVGMTYKATDTLHFQRKITTYGVGSTVLSERCEWKTLKVDVTFKAVNATDIQWVIDSISPPSGESTGEDRVTESILLSYDSHSCLAVLQDMCSQWKDWEWAVVSPECACVNGETLVCATLRMCKKDEWDTYHDFDRHQLAFGRSGGIDSIRSKYADQSNIPSRVYFYGGSQNLPRFYRSTRLCLPNKAKEESYIDFAEMAKPFQLGIDNSTCEEVVCLDEIFPANEPFELKSDCVIAMFDNTYDGKHYLSLQIPKSRFFLVNDVWKSVDGVNPDPNDFAEWMLLTGEGNTSESRERYMEYFYETSKYMAGRTPMVTFQTGELSGYSLSLHSCSKVTEGGVEYIYMLLNVVKEDNTFGGDEYTPNTDRKPSYGDKFIIEDIDMPVSYTYPTGTDGDFSAETKLWRAALEYMDNISEKVDYELGLSRYHIIHNDEVGRQYRCFDTVTFPNVMDTGVTSTVERRVSAVERDLVDGYSVRITITNKSVQHPMAVLRKMLASTNRKAMQ